MRILLTGAAGFIGHSVTLNLLARGESVFGIDNLNKYYEPSLKLNRLKNIEDQTLKRNNFQWQFKKCDLNDLNLLENIFNDFKPNVVVNLAAQAGVRYSIKNPKDYIQSNILGFSNILEKCAKFEVENLIYASSSSVYGAYKKHPFNENNPVGHPLSLYAATKRSNELLAHSYSNIHKLPATGLRFFTVYGPWGRPDMAPFIFTKSILEDKPIKIFNFGRMERDFTYIDDISEAVTKCCYKKATSSESFNNESPENAISFAPHRIFNIGNSKSINLLYFIETIEKELGKKAKKIYEPIQAGDVLSTYSDTNRLEKWIEYKPKTSIEKGVKLFIDWYKKYYAC